MNVFKITNITNSLNKRDFYFDSSLKFDYADGLRKKTISLGAGKTVFLKIKSLPISLHKLRSKGLITIVETDENITTDQLMEKKRVLSSKNTVKTGGNVGDKTKKTVSTYQKRKTTTSRKSTPKKTEPDSEEKKD